MNVAYIKNEGIDKSKWDRCIEMSGNGSIYGYSYYLDNMSKHWDALVMGDYDIVMPLTWNRKYGIYYLYQPFFTASLGIFGNDLTSEIVASFLKSIPARFKFWDIYLNRGNLFTIPSFNLYSRSNFILDLNKKYDELRTNYSSNHIRNIKKAEDQGCYTKRNIPIASIIQLAKNNSKNFSPLRATDYDNLVKVYEFLKTQSNAVTYGAYDGNHKLLSSCVFFFSHGRAYYILVGNDPAGKTIGSSHFLIDAFIKERAGEKLTLDFEGSNLPGIALFYKGFGATEEKYTGIKMNDLPALIKLFKK